jgi:hypothetical protein
MILVATFATLALVCGLGGFFIFSAVRQAAESQGVSFDKGGITHKDPTTGQTSRIGNVDPSELTPEEREWYFPGAQIVVYTSEGDGNSLTMVMQTEDSLDEALAFYKKKLGPEVHTSDIRDGGDRTISLSGESSNVTIIDESGPGPNQIVVALSDPSGEEEFVEGEDGEIPEVPDVDVDIPEVPEPPTPPPPPAKAPRAPGT